MMTTDESDKQYLWWLWISIFVMLVIQCIAISRPFLGHFSNYQSGMMDIAKTMLREPPGEWLYPKLSHVTAGMRSLHLNQYPMPSLVLAWCQKVIPVSFEFWGRAQMVAFHVASIFLFFRIVSRLWTVRLAAVSAMLYTISPYMIVYGQSFMCETPGVFFFLLSLFWLVRKYGHKLTFADIFISGILMSFSVLNRIHYVLLIPTALYFVWLLSNRKIYHSVVFLGLSSLLSGAWYFFVYQVIQTHDNVVKHVFMQVNSDKILNLTVLRDLEFYKHLFDVFTQNILTPLFFPFTLLGIILMFRKKMFSLPLLLWTFSLVSTSVLFPKKVLDHEFYLMPAAIALFVPTSFSVTHLIESFFKDTSTRTIGSVVVLGFLVSARFFAHPMYVISETEKNVISATQAVQELTPSNSVIVAAHDGAPAVLYYSDRMGFTFHEKGQVEPSAYWLKDAASKLTKDELTHREDAFKNSVTWLEYLREQGASYFVCVDKSALEANLPLFNHLNSQYQLTSRPEQAFYLYNLS